MTQAAVPSSLFKYFGHDRISSIESNRLRFSPLSAFNDPFEGRPEIKGLASPVEFIRNLESELPKELKAAYLKLTRQQRSQMSLRQFVALGIAKTNMESTAAEFGSMTDAFAASVPDRLDGLLGALCLCENRDSLLMWAHYAASHTGFMVEYATDGPFFNARRSPSDEFYYLRQVQYRETRPSASLTQFDGPELFLVKSLDWSYEHEWRILKPLADADVVLDISGQKIHLFNHAPGVILSITVGARANAALQDQIRLLLSTTPQLSHVKLFQAHAHVSHFKLELLELAI